MRFRDIPQLTTDGSYQVNIPWVDLEDWLSRNFSECGLDIDPPFQRAHVWTKDQQVAFVEFMLRGGKASNQLRFNCVGWMRSFAGPFVLVDGKQRLEAVRRFMANDLCVFGGHRRRDLGKMSPFKYDFLVMVNNLPDMASVLRWYLEINDGGVVHAKEDLDKVREMLAVEEKQEGAKP